MANYLRLLFIVIAILKIAACSTQADIKTNQSTNGNQTENVTDTCPVKPPGTLMAEETQQITLTSNPTAVSGQVTTRKSQGYIFEIFESPAGQTLNYETAQDICIWLYTPTNKLIEQQRTQLEEGGKYTLQVAAPQGSRTFELTLWVGTKETVEQPVPSSKPDQNQPDGSEENSNVYSFSASDYPQTICGDQPPTDPNVYPIKFYRVRVPLRESNESRAKSLFCKDAYAISADNAIQIASFQTQEKAEAFSKFVDQKISGAFVTEITVNRP